MKSNCNLRTKGACGGQRSTSVSSLLFFLVVSVLETKSLNEAGVHRLGENGWPASPGICLSHPQQCTGRGTHCSWLFCGCWVCNSGPHACVTNTLPTELSLHFGPRNMHLFGAVPKPFMGHLHSLWESSLNSVS